MLSYCTNQDNLVDQRNLAKSKWKDYTKSEDKWESQENILQTFVQMLKKENQVAIAVVVLAHVAEQEKLILNWFQQSQRK